MGYTHYWYRAADQDNAKWAAFVADCRKVCEALAIPLGDGHGEGTPIFSDDLVAFNGHVKSGEMMPQSVRVNGLLWPAHKAEGIADWKTDSAEAGTWSAGPQVSKRVLPENGDGSYESFIVDAVPGRCFDCCKTNFHPYDLAVQCCLIALKEHFGNSVAVRSDGNQSAWAEASDVCQHVLGYGLLFELDTRESVKGIESKWEAATAQREAEERKVKYGHYPPAPKDRDEAIKRIRTALRRRTGRAWSVKGGRGTAWGWIEISAPPRRKVNWEMTEEDCVILANALGLERKGPVSIPASIGHRTEYVDRAEGREPRECGECYWD